LRQLYSSELALASSYFAKTKIVGVVGDDFASEDERFLVDRGIDIEGLERVSGKTFFWSGVRADKSVIRNYKPSAAGNCLKPISGRRKWMS